MAIDSSDFGSMQMEGGLKAKFIFASLAVALALPSGATTHYHYSAVGQRTAQTSAEGHTSRYSYDSLGQATDPQGNTSTYHYNSQGHLLAQTDAEGKTTHYGYDKAGRSVMRTLADGTSAGWGFDQSPGTRRGMRARQLG